MLCLLTTLSRYLRRSEGSSIGSTSNSQVLGQCSGLGVLSEVSGVSVGATVRLGASGSKQRTDLAAHRHLSTNSQEARLSSRGLWIPEPTYFRGNVFPLCWVTRVWPRTMQ